VIGVSVLVVADLGLDLFDIHASTGNFSQGFLLPGSPGIACAIHIPQGCDLRMSIPYIRFVGNIESKKAVLDQCLKTSYNPIAQQILPEQECGKNKVSHFARPGFAIQVIPAGLQIRREQLG
jgi:hypothetical protein